MEIAPRPRLRPIEILVPAIFIVLGIGLIPVGPAIFSHLRPILEHLPIKHLWAIALQFANPLTSLIAAAIIWFLDRRRRYFVVYLFVSMLLVAAINSSIKEISGRRRPEWSVALNASREQALRLFAEKYPDRYFPITRQDSWSLLRPNRIWFSDKNASFPSGHAAAAFALAAFLCFVYPRGSVVWIGLAVLAALVRVKSAHHYLEDVMVGGALAWLLSQWCYTWQWPARIGQKLSRWCRKPSPACVREIPRDSGSLAEANHRKTAIGEQ